MLNFSRRKRVKEVTQGLPQEACFVPAIIYWLHFNPRRRPVEMSVFFLGSAGGEGSSIHGGPGFLGHRNDVNFLFKETANEKR